MIDESTISAQLESIKRDLHVVRVLFGISIIILALLLTIIMPITIHNNWPFGSREAFADNSAHYTPKRAHAVEPAPMAQATTTATTTVTTTVIATTTVDIKKKP